jgi:hypothetical protein
MIIMNHSQYSLGNRQSVTSVNLLATIVIASPIRNKTAIKI